MIIVKKCSANDRCYHGPAYQNIDQFGDKGNLKTCLTCRAKAYKRRKKSGFKGIVSPPLPGSHYRWLARLASEARPTLDNVTAVSSYKENDNE